MGEQPIVDVLCYSSQVGDVVKVRILGVDEGKISLTMKPYVEGEEMPKKRERRSKQDDGADGPGDRRKRPDRIEDIWSDNTEPKWKEIQASIMEKQEEYGNVLELKL